MTHLVFFFFHGASEYSAPAPEPVRTGRTVRVDIRGAVRVEYREPVRVDYRPARRDLL